MKTCSELFSFVVKAVVGIVFAVGLMFILTGGM